MHPMRSGQLKASVCPPAKLSAEARDGMWSLFSRFYVSVTREQFESDLDKKHRVIVCRDSGDGSIQGFSTMKEFEAQIDGRTAMGIFSGDTIIDPRYWGQSALQVTFYLEVLKFKLRHFWRPVFWFLISKGFKTYLLLSRNFVEYWPRYDRPTPQWQGRVLDAFATQLYPDAWRKELGVMKFEQCVGALRDGVAPIDTEALAAPDIAFFLKKNPGHSQGDELACLGKLDLPNFLGYGWKALRKAFGLSNRPRALPADAQPQARTTR